MLQQTQVERVVAYFERFIDRFPTVEHLAAASVDDVLACWSGLGYYRRARSLHAAARQIVAEGSFPRDIDGWRALPGIGPYTAAAVMSIAFGLRQAALDGNVERVVSRFGAIEGDIKRVAGRRLLLGAAEELLDGKRPGDSNQALMELGATVCRPRRPRCGECPLSASCQAYAQGAVLEFPLTRPRRRSVKQLLLGVVVERPDGVFMVRRSERDVVLSGLWELPCVPWTDRDTAVTELSKRYGGVWTLDESCGWIRHSITHRDIRLEVWRGRVESAAEIREVTTAAFFSRRQMQNLALSSLVEKMLQRAKT